MGSFTRKSEDNRFLLSHTACASIKGLRRLNDLRENH